MKFFIWAFRYKVFSAPLALTVLFCPVVIKTCSATKPRSVFVRNKCLTTLIAFFASQLQPPRLPTTRRTKHALRWTMLCE
jgi:hypothetical protein